MTQSFEVINYIIFLIVLPNEDKRNRNYYYYYGNFDKEYDCVVPVSFISLSGQKGICNMENPKR